MKFIDDLSSSVFGPLSFSFTAAGDLFEKFSRFLALLETDIGAGMLAICKVVFTGWS